MHLREIEIKGFKSFADKTILQFPEGISAIVGPNGSGKSNVVDALR
jgi:chromosome segregation protein